MRIVASLALASLVFLQQQTPPAGQPPAGGQRQGRGGGGGFRQPDPYDFDEHDGWTSLFDGKTLNGWSGDSNWKVEDGAITIEPSCEHPTGTVYLVWQGGDTSDFELKLRMKGTGNINSGVQYRSWIAPDPPRPAPPAAAPGAAPPQPQRGGGGSCPSGAPRGTPPDRKSEEQWNMWGAQYDFDAANRYTGQYYEQSTGRGIIAWKGQIVRTETGKNPRLLAMIGDQAIVDSIYKPNDWNELHIIAIGNQMTHLLNGRVISILIDDDTQKFHKSGKIGIEVESTGKLFTKDIWLKKLP
jgi:3-keto-disaccharide hydrolase